jgi:hypothetical protein
MSCETDHCELAFGKGHWFLTLGHNFILLLSRAAGILVLIIAATTGAEAFEILPVLICGGLWDGFLRSGYPRNAQYFQTAPDHFIVRAGGRLHKVPWDRLCAMESWRHFNGYCFVVAHLVADVELGLSVYGCDQQASEDELRTFVTQCAVRARNLRTAGPDAVLAGWTDRAVWSPHVKRICIDTAAGMTLLLLFGARGGQLLLTACYPVASAVSNALIRHPMRRREYSCNDRNASVRRLRYWLDQTT